MALGPHAACVVHHKEYETVRRPRARVALPHGRTLNFTVTWWLLPKEATTGRPPLLSLKKKEVYPWTREIPFRQTDAPIRTNPRRGDA
jgi:hypothetical protein